MEQIKLFYTAFSDILSVYTLPFIILIFLIAALFKKIKVYEVFVSGAKEGFSVAVTIIPYLVAILVAISMFRASGAMDLLIQLLKPLFDLINFPVEALPMAFMRPLSGSGSQGIMVEIFKSHGPDSFLGNLVSTMFGSTETTFYVLAVYFGSVQIRNSRHALAAGLIADFVGLTAAFLVCRIIF